MKIKAKVDFIGESGVGKTSIIKRKKCGVFEGKWLPTVISSTQMIAESYEDVIYELFIWDTAGQETYNALAPLYLRDANFVIIVGSIVDQKSLENIMKWYQMVVDSGENPEIAVAINKIDMLDDDSTHIDEVREWLVEEKFESIFFVSAKTGDGIEELFYHIVQTLHQKRDSLKPVSQKIEVIDGDTRKSCC